MERNSSENMEQDNKRKLQRKKMRANSRTFKREQKFAEKVKRPADIEKEKENMVNLKDKVNKQQIVIKKLQWKPSIGRHS